MYSAGKSSEKIKIRYLRLDLLATLLNAIRLKYIICMVRYLCPLNRISVDTYLKTTFLAR